MDLATFHDKMVAIDEGGRKRLREFEQLMTNPEQIACAAANLSVIFNEVERELSQYYIGMIAGLGRAGITLGAGLAATSHRILVPIDVIEGTGSEPTVDSRELRWIFTMPERALDCHQHVLLVTPALLTGRTTLAAAKFIRDQGAQLHGVLTLVEFAELGGRQRLEDAKCLVQAVMET